MRRAILATVTAAVVAIGALGSAGAFASTPRTRTTTIRLTAHFTKQAILDLGDAGPSVGDQQIGVGKLTRGDTTVGHFGIVCSFLAFADSPTGDCTVTARLAKGTISLQGYLNNNVDDNTLAVVGGTGDYRDAAGQALIHGVNDTTNKVTLELD
jgi:hypothetical protein